MSSNTSDYIYPVIVPSDYDIEDAFSSTRTPDYTPASPDYSPASLRNTSPNPPDDLSKYLLASLAILPFHDDPYMKILPPQKRVRFLSSSYTDSSAPPQVFEIGENYHGAPDMSYARHEEQIDVILNHSDELPLERMQP
ncbi:hypothetical protein Tco_1111767 [Tanacetum coccineum]|uniref:Uncharacterized protein n=1 Tax=Tanacetum coccineum TaxID=301880 RepID=A0ABQ5IMY0_9ASTR